MQKFEKLKKLKGIDAEIKEVKMLINKQFEKEDTLNV